MACRADSGRMAATDAAEVTFVRRWVVAAFAVVLAAASMGTGSAAPRSETCLGAVATITGTDGPDDLTGTSGDDVVWLGDGDDVFRGGSGNDRICGGAGNDEIYGEEGLDRIDGGGGADRLFGGPDADWLAGGGANDRLEGEAGDDTLLGGDGRDQLLGQAGDDTLDGGPKNDRLKGGGGADILLGGSGNDVLRGQAGDDTLNGGGGTDTDLGGGGRDACHQGDETRRGCDYQGGCLPRYGQPYDVATVGGAYEMRSAVGDFTGDGLDDVIVSWTRFGFMESFEWDLLVNDGRGGLTVRTDQVIQGGVPETFFMGQNGRDVVADLNGDGVDDYFFPDWGMDASPHPGAQNVLLLSTGDGKLRNATDELPQLLDNPHDTAVGDADGDGDLDIFVVSMWGRPEVAPYLLVNNGRGRFTIGGDLPADIELRQNWFVAGAFADVDQNGTADLLLGTGGEFMGNPLSVIGSMVLLNDGDARFTPLPDALPPGPFTDDRPVGGLGYHLLPADLDLDGYPDLIVNSTRQDYSGRMLQVLINNGDGTFRDETNARMTQSRNSNATYSTVRLIDLNRDGAVDILAESIWDWIEKEPFVYLNDGRGRFEGVDHDFNMYHEVFNIIDIDGDGGRDILEGGWADGPEPVDFGVIPDRGCG